MSQDDTENRKQWVANLLRFSGLEVGIALVCAAVIAIAIMW